MTYNGANGIPLIQSLIKNDYVIVNNLFFPKVSAIFFSVNTFRAPGLLLEAGVPIV